MAFVKGQSGNPGGRTKGVSDLRELCRKFTPEGIDLLMDIARNGQKEAARVTAINSIIDRGYGKAPTTLADEDGNDLGKLIVEVVRYGSAGRQG